MVKLYFIYGLSHAEIAKRMNIEEKTVRNHKARALQLIKASLSKKNLLTINAFATLLWRFGCNSWKHLPIPCEKIFLNSLGENSTQLFYSCKPPIMQINTEIIAILKNTWVMRNSVLKNHYFFANGLGKK